MSYAIVFLLSFLIICAVSVALTKNLLHAVLIQMGYSTIMAVIWLLLESPDLAITEAAVGAGVTGILFFITLRRIVAIAGRGRRWK
jgi:uncharacterized MnhB-related membrane protein